MIVANIPRVSPYLEPTTMEFHRSDDEKMVD